MWSRLRARYSHGASLDADRQIFSQEDEKYPNFCHFTAPHDRSDFLKRTTAQKQTITTAHHTRT